MRNGNQEILAEIQGLRAVAVLAVIIFHYQKDYLPLGYLGVDIFFTISGFVITKSILKQASEGAFTFSGFFISRAKRLLPALAFVLTTTMILSALLLPAKSPLITGMSSFFGISNFWLWYSGADYFALSSEWNPLTHTWSLGVEEQFYLLFPLLLYVLNWDHKKILVGLTIIVTISLAAYFIFWQQQRITVFYLVPFRIWELGTGGIIYLLSKRTTYLERFSAVYLVKYLLLAGLLFILYDSRVAENHATFFTVLSTSGILLLCKQGKRQNQILIVPALQFIGRISYSLYLYHWPTIIFAKLLLPAILVLPGYVFFTLALSITSFYILEQPIRHMPWNFAKNKILLAVSIYASAFSFFGLGIWFLKPHLFLGPAAVLETQFLKNSTCHIPNKNNLPSCLTRHNDGRKTIWLVGDSHAGNFVPALQNSSHQLNANFQFMTGRSLFLSLQDLCLDSNCPEGSYLSQAERLRAASSVGDIVVISFAHDRFKSPPNAQEPFFENFQSFIGLIKRSKLKVVFVQDIPKVCDDDGAYFRSIYAKDVCQVTSELSSQAQAPTNAMFENIARRSGTTIINPHDLLCETTVGGKLECSNYLHSELIYLDSSPHLTRKASLSLSEFFTRSLKTVFEKE